MATPPSSDPAGALGSLVGSRGAAQLSAVHCSQSSPPRHSPSSQVTAAFSSLVETQLPSLVQYVQMFDPHIAPGSDD
jgi:hypothetical protein